MNSWSALIAIGVITLQLLFIAALLTLRARKLREEEALRSNEAALKASYERVRRLAGRLINAREAMRAHIARDLHDDVCQELAGLSVAISDLKHRRWDIQDSKAQEVLARVQFRALGLVERVRRLSHDLHPNALQHIRIAAALEALCIEIEQRYDLQVSIGTRGDFTSISADTELCLFRIAEEALRNAAVHGTARRAAVFIARTDECVELAISDDGNGFDLVDTRRNGIGLGLESMEERAHLMGGELYIVTEPSLGTTIHVRIPTNIHAEERTVVAEHA